MNELEEKLQEYLVAKSAALLNVDRAEIGWEDDLDEYGYSSMEVNQLCVDINHDFSIEIHPALFLEVTSLKALSDHLRQSHNDAVEDKLL